MSNAKLTAAAKKASRRAYAPYSGFPVGAAVLAGSGRIYSAANVENASYGLAICAERAAIFAACAAGERRITAVAVHLPTRDTGFPCGACRQVINEFGPTARIICTSRGTRPVETTLPALLPHPFGPSNLPPPPRDRP